MSDEVTGPNPASDAGTIAAINIVAREVEGVRRMLDRLRLHFDQRLDPIEERQISHGHRLDQINGTVRKHDDWITGHDSEARVRLGIERDKALAASVRRAERQRWYRWALMVGSFVARLGGKNIAVAVLAALGLGAVAERVLGWWP